MPKRPVPHPVLRVVRNVGGLLLVLFGLVGFVLPIIPGFVFVIAGLTLIDLPQKQAAHRWLQRYRWYRWVARKHHAAWRAFKQRRRTRKQTATPARQGR
jgi:uncharacterized membrane protein YbaN (DUF454 family)